MGYDEGYNPQQDKYKGDNKEFRKMTRTISLPCQY